MENASTNYIRNQLARHLEGGEAFITIDAMVNKLNFEQLGVVPEGLPYSIWQQFSHMRFTQLDILEFSRNPAYKEPKWPDDYWPKEKAPENVSDWDEMVETFFKERQEFIDIINNPANDLFTPIPHGDGQTLFREALLIIEHNAYHTGQILIISRILGLY